MVPIGVGDGHLLGLIPSVGVEGTIDAPAGEALEETSKGFATEPNFLFPILLFEIEKLFLKLLVVDGLIFFTPAFVPHQEFDCELVLVVDGQLVCSHLIYINHVDVHSPKLQ